MTEKLSEEIERLREINKEKKSELRKDICRNVIIYVRLILLNWLIGIIDIAIRQHIPNIFVLIVVNIILILIAYLIATKGKLSEVLEFKLNNIADVVNGYLFFINPIIITVFYFIDIDMINK